MIHFVCARATVLEKEGGEQAVKDAAADLLKELKDCDAMPSAILDETLRAVAGVRGEGRPSVVKEG